MPRRFYLARLIGSDGGLLASEEVWNPQDATPEQDAAFTPERAALDAATFFHSDEHDADPAGNTIQLFGPYTVDTARPAHLFQIEEDDRPEARDYWTAERIGGEG